MKYVWLLTAIALFVISIVVYYRKRNTAPEASGNTPMTTVKFSTTLIDVGEIKLNVPIEVSYTIYNTGQHALYIQRAVPDCHCTVADYSSNPIRPNDSSIIKLKFDASRPGAFQSSAVITTNSPTSPVLLVLRGNTR
ncbi:DUF1573 domain-containing protein [Paraflavitalea speifideaquila]|uniref:DUF1573 domain-containing protein n=1 Tax=Paraflavitalea speifideaquila TaxID=3076558 RepID=UPI0028E4413C|nr:DUF1573 domain-containing protein [Paraflavitalea speifideiaquila]